jgi:outer membrane efflux protein
VLFFVRNFGTVGVNLNYTLRDFGKRRATVREHADQLAEAEQNLERLKEQVAVGIERNYNKLERTWSMVNVATQVAKLRQESQGSTDQAAQGIVLISEVSTLPPQAIRAKRISWQATLGYVMAWAALQRTLGQAPGLAMKSCLEANYPLAQPPPIVRSYGPERNALFAIGILPVQSGTTISTPVSKHQRPEAFQRP